MHKFCLEFCCFIFCLLIAETICTDLPACSAEGCPAYSHEENPFSRPVQSSRSVSKLYLLLQCSCDNETEIPFQRLKSIFQGVGAPLLKVILYNEKGNTITSNRIEDGCDNLCSGTTPTTPSRDLSFKTLLNMTLDVIQSEREWMETDAINELHVIAILPRYRDNPRYSSKEEYHPLITSILEETLTKQTSLLFIVEPKGDMKLMGDPLQTVSYGDGTHFNKGLTLAGLLSSGQGESVQAHFLAAGLYCSVAQYNRTALQDVYSSPFFWGLLPLNVQYKDACKGIECLHYCSPLHGCVDKEKERGGSVQVGKVSLAEVEFVTSHAEYKGLWSNLTSFSLDETEQLSILRPSSSSSSPFPLSSIVTGSPRTVQWTSYDDIVDANEPLLIKSKDLSKWGAFSHWNMSYLSNHIRETPFVKCSNDYLTFDPDPKAPLKLNLSLPYKVRNMSGDAFFACVGGNECNNTFKGHYYFGQVPKALKGDLRPNSFIYRTDEDRKAAKQYMWISSSGMITHGHFDQDYNLFVQVLGTKRFTLWPPSQHEHLYMFPRVHPLWHKSRINFRDVDIGSFPDFTRSRAVQATLGPGDMLFVPPYTWHYVETLSPSVSLSTWSHDYRMYYHMNAVYGHDHKFDLIGSRKGQMYTLRLFLDMLVQDLYGFNETTVYFARLLAARFSGLEDLFPPERDDPRLCEGIKGQIPLSYHTHGFVKLDVQVIGEHFKALGSIEVMDILFANYVEEISSQIVGVDKLAAFFRYCFQGQTYTVTSPGQPEHSLWDYPDPPQE